MKKVKNKNTLSSLSELLNPLEVEKTMKEVVEAFPPFPQEGDTGWIVIERAKRVIEVVSPDRALYKHEYEVRQGGTLEFSHYNSDFKKVLVWSKVSALTPVVGAYKSEEEAKKAAEEMAVRTFEDDYISIPSGQSHDWGWMDRDRPW